MAIVKSARLYQDPRISHDILTLGPINKLTKPAAKHKRNPFGRDTNSPVGYDYFCCYCAAQLEFNMAVTLTVPID